MNEFTVTHINDISFSYDSKMVLKNISIDINPGQIYFIMGNNGSGKTTLLKNILGILSPQSGNILINGIDVSSIDKRALSRMVCYVPQAISINTDFSVINFLSLGRTPYLGFSGKLNDEDFQIIDKYARLLNVEKSYNTPFNKLSGGQKQMVAITRSLIQDTPMLILDEPMSALDIGKQVDVLRLLYKISEEGKTVIITTHNPNHALTIESNSCFLKNGRVVSFGKSDEIIQESLIQEIYGRNIAVDYGKTTTSVVFNKNELK